MSEEKTSEGYAFYCTCQPGRLVDLRKQAHTFCVGCGVFYHRMHDKAKTISGYVPPPTRENCLCNDCAQPVQGELFA